MNLNKTFVLGRLTQDPERRNLPSGQPVVNFGMATNRYYNTQDGQRQEDTQFHNIVIFGKLAEIAYQYLKKGSLTLIEGRLQTRNWQDASGQKKYKTEIVAERMQLGPRTATAQIATEFQPTSPKPQVKEAVQNEEIPVIEEETKPKSQLPHQNQAPATEQAKPEEKTEAVTPEGDKPPPIDVAPPAETSPNNPGNNPAANSLPNDQQEIDVRDIPF